jgi:hypothetical protein
MCSNMVNPENHLIKNYAVVRFAANGAAIRVALVFGGENSTDRPFTSFGTAFPAFFFVTLFLLFLLSSPFAFLPPKSTLDNVRYAK